MVNPLNNAPGVYLIIEIFQGAYWREPLKKEALIKSIKLRNCV